MSRVMFFCIPAHGHVNPTIEVVRALIQRGHRVRYYSFPEFKDKIEDAGAEYVSCEAYLPPAPEDIEKKVGKDFASLIEMVVDTTVNLEEMIEIEIKDFAPDCIISDSVCFWGKLFAKKYKVPFICSTTTMAFNKHTAKLMKQKPSEIVRMFMGMPRIVKKIGLLNEHGYDIDNFVSVIQNDNDTNTIVYTSEKFQPMAETFSEKYIFIGPSVAQTESKKKPKKRPQVYISLGTVLSKNIKFYKHCILALKDMDCDVIISAGKDTDISLLGEVPPSFHIQPYVNQLEVLADTDVFVTHCGMNSVNESLYYGVPMVLFPQHSEENAVAIRTEQLGAGFRLKKVSENTIKKAVAEVLANSRYKENAMKMREDFRQCKGALGAVAFIENVVEEDGKKLEKKVDNHNI